MKIFSVCIAAVFAVSASAHVLPERVYRAAQERIDAGYYPVLVIAYADGQADEIETFGKLDDGKPLDGDTVFEIGSITKTFTATLLASEIKNGSLTLDARVSTLVPDFSIPSRNGKAITVEDIATQTSGLPRMPTNFSPAAPDDPYADYGATQLKAFLASYQLTRDPAESFEYSNLGFGLLGFALAERAHMPYGTLVDKKIFRPLGMTMSDVTTTPKLQAHLAPGHLADGKPAKEWNFDAFAGAGSIRSTGNDLLRYLKANMGVSKTTLLPAMQLAQQPRRDIGGDSKIGLAWMIADAKHQNVISHGGATGGYTSFIGFTKDRKRGVVVLTNIDSSPEELGFAALLDDQPISKTHSMTRVAIEPAKLDDYVGLYRLGDSLLVTIVRDGGNLVAQAAGQGPFELFSSGGDEFFAKIGDISESFKRDANHRVIGFVNHQRGDTNATKLSALEAANANKAIRLDDTTLQDYIGRYQLDAKSMFELRVNDGQPYMSLTGQPAFPIFAREKDKFFYAVVDAQLDFQRDESGKIVAVVLHQDGKDQRAPKITP